MDTCDFAVVGGGIAGASAGYELASLGKTIVLEQERVAGHHTTGRSAALFTESWEHGVVRSLTTASRSFLEHPPDGFANYPLLASLPLMLIGRSDQMRTLSALRDDAVSLPGVEFLDGPGALAACPLLRPGYVAQAILEPSSFEIDVNELHQGFLRGLRHRGGELRLGAEVSRLSKGKDGWIVEAGDSTISAGVIVNAAGAWADVVAQRAGLEPIGLIPYRRTAFAFPSPTETAGMPMVVDVDEEFYFKPEPGRFMGSLAEETPMEPHDVRPEEIDVALAIDRIRAATTLEIRHVSQTWAGLRTFVADRLPVVGIDPEHPDFLWLAGQGGSGIMTSPAMGNLAASLATEGEVPPALTAVGVTAPALAPGRLRS